MENVKVLIDGIQKDVYGLFYIYDSKYYFIYTEKEIVENDYVVLYMCQVGKETKNTQSGPIDTGYMIGAAISTPEEQQKAQTAVSYIVEDKKNKTQNSLIQYLPMNMLTNLKIVSKKRFRLLKTIVSENFGVPLDNIQSQAITQPVSASAVQTEVQPQQTLVAPVMIPEVPTNVAQPLESIQPVAPVAPVAPVQPQQTPVAPVPEAPTNVVQPLELIQPVAPVAPVQPQQTLAAPVTIPEIPTNVAQPLESIQPATQANVQVEAQSLQPLANPQIQTGQETNNNDLNVIVDYRTKYFEEEEKNKELQMQIDDLTKKLNEIKKVIE